MKSSTIKKIIVKCANFWMEEFEINSELFDDAYLEAATRAIEKRKHDNSFKVTIVLECWEKKDFKKPDKHICYNTYLVFINAAMHEKAEILRMNFLKMHGIDLRKENLRGNNDGSKKN